MKRKEDNWKSKGRERGGDRGGIERWRERGVKEWEGEGE